MFGVVEGVLNLSEFEFAVVVVDDEFFDEFNNNVGASK